MKKSNILKLILVIGIVVVLAVSVWESLPKILDEVILTPMHLIALTVLATVMYHFFEGVITTNFARRYEPDFSLWKGFMCAFYASFYRVSTLGSGQGIAVIYYLSKQKIKVHEGMGMYMIEYVVHKLSIAIFSLIFVAINFKNVMSLSGKYFWLLVSGYGITVLIVCFLVALCLSDILHSFIIKLLIKLDFKKIFSSKISELSILFDNISHSSKVCCSDATFVFKQILWNLIKFACWYIIPFILLKDDGLTIMGSFSFTSMSTLLAAVIPAPAGIGSFEYVYTLIFERIVGRIDAASSVLIYRFATYILPMFIGLPVVIVCNKKYRHA